jgi:small subunit ribosomal protein S6
MVVPYSLLCDNSYRAKYPEGGNMRRYETIFIVDPDVPDDQRGLIFTRLDELFVQFSGFQVARDEWGVKKLAYDIRKRTRGFYVRLDYCGDGPLVDEIERFFRIDDKILKFMTIVLAKDVDLEKVKEEMLKSAEEKKAAAELTSENQLAVATEIETYETEEEDTEA